MKITFKTGELLKVLREMVKIIPSATTHPAFKSVLIQADLKGQKVEIIASNGNVTLRQTMYDLLLDSPVTIEESGTVLLPGRELLEIAKRAGEQITLKSKVATRVSVSLTRAKYELAGIDPSAFHPFENKSETVSTKIPVVALKRLIERTSYATSKSETRPILKGVNIVLSETGTIARATDGLRLARAESPVQANERLDITLRSDALEMLASLMPDDDDEIVYLEIGGTSMVALWNDGCSELSMLGLDGEFPNTEKIMPRQFKHVFHIDRQELQDALSRVAIVALANTKDNLITQITVSNGQLQLYAESPVCGQVKDSVAIKGEIEGEFAFAANIRFLTDAVKALSAEDVEFCFNAPNQPFVIRDDKSIGLVSPLLMPAKQEEKSA